MAHELKSVKYESEHHECEHHSVPTKRCLILSTGVICASFFCMYFAYTSLEGLQSSLNAEGGIGQIGLSTLYSGFILSSFFIGQPLIERIGPKWAITFGLFCYTPYVASNLYVKWFTMIPASFLLGMGSGTAWVGSGTYLTVIAMEYAEITGQTKESCLNKVNSVFWGIFCLPKVLGNALSGFLLNQSTYQLGTVNNSDSGNQKGGGIYNTTIFSTSLYPTSTVTDSTNISCKSNSSSSFAHCGKNYCPYLQEHVNALVQPDGILVVIFISILTAFSLLAVVIAGLMPNLKNRANTTAKKALSQRLLVTVRLFLDVRLWLLIPLLIFTAAAHATYATGFTQSFISCTQGVSWIGYIMMFEGACRTLVSFLCGPVSKFIPRWFQLLAALVTQMVLCITWLLWKPSNNLLPLFIWAVGIAFVTGITWTFASAIVGQLFPDKKEAAFAQYNGWRGIGFTVTFGYANFLCYEVKTCILLGLCVLTTVTYIALEILTRRQYNQQEAWELKINTKADKNIVGLEQEQEKSLL